MRVEPFRNFPVDHMDDVKWLMYERRQIVGLRALGFGTGIAASGDLEVIAALSVDLAGRSTAQEH